MCPNATPPPVCARSTQHRRTPTRTESPGPAASGAAGIMAGFCDFTGKLAYSLSLRFACPTLAPEVARVPSAVAVEAPLRVTADEYVCRRTLLSRPISPSPSRCDLLLRRCYCYWYCAQYLPLPVGLCESPPRAPTVTLKVQLSSAPSPSGTAAAVAPRRRTLGPGRGREAQQSQPSGASPPP